MIKKIGFIGVGVMGAPIARRLAGAGYDITVCDVNSAAADSLSDCAAVVTSPSGCAKLDLVFILVSTDAQVKNVLFAADGLAPAIDPSRPPCIVVMSTVQPDTVRALALHQALKNVPILDAPISGGLDGAISGALSVMVGGDRAHFEMVNPALEKVGTKVAYCGPLGNGSTTKILNNLIGVANWLLMGEAMSLAASLGLDLDNLAAVMDTGSGRNFSTSNWASRRALYGVYAGKPELVGSNMEICEKDLSLFLQLARQAGAELPISRGLHQVVSQTHASAIHSAWAPLVS